MIFKYALEGSRVYIDILSSGAEVILIIKNISAHELNISSDELMERFKRGDESRGSQSSGLGLSIAKGLIEIQKGGIPLAPPQAENFNSSHNHGIYRPW